MQVTVKRHSRLTFSGGISIGIAKIRRTRVQIAIEMKPETICWRPGQEKVKRKSTGRSPGYYFCTLKIGNSINVGDSFSLVIDETIDKKLAKISFFAPEGTQVEVSTLDLSELKSRMSAA